MEKGGEGFYLDNGYSNLLHFRFHPPYTTEIYSKVDLSTFYLIRKTNIEKAKKRKQNFFVNPLFIIGNREKEIRLGLYRFIKAKSKNEYFLYQYFFSINTKKRKK